MAPTNTNSSSSSTDGDLVLTVPKGTDVNLRLVATTDQPSWRWSSSSSGLVAAADPDSVVHEGTGDIDIWLKAGKSITIKLDQA